MTKIIGVNEWSEVILLEDGDKLSGGIDGKANEQSIALVNRTNWLKEKVEDASSGINKSDEEKLLWLSTNLADPLLSSKYPKAGQVLAVSEAKSNLSGKETLTYKLIDLPAEGTKGETGPVGPQGEQGVQGEYGSFANVTNRGQWYPWDTYAINDMVRYRMEGGVVDQTYISLINENLGNPPNSHPSSQEWAMISQDGRDGQGGGGGVGGGGVESLNTFSGTVAIQGSGVATIDNQGNIITVNVPAPKYPVTSVNGQSGAVVIDTSSLIAREYHSFHTIPVLAPYAFETAYIPYVLLTFENALVDVKVWIGEDIVVPLAGILTEAPTGQYFPAQYLLNGNPTESGWNVIVQNISEVFYTVFGEFSRDQILGIQVSVTKMQGGQGDS